jgi:LemA protein
VHLGGARVVPRTHHEDVFRRDDDRGFLAKVFDNRTGRYRETERIVGIGDGLFVCGDAVLDRRTFVPTLVEDVLVSTRSEESHTSRLGAGVGALLALGAGGLTVGSALLLDPDEPGRPEAWLPGLVAAVVLLLAAWVVTTYNRLHVVAEGADRAWSLIDVQLQRRHDLVPALASVVAAHAAHEREVLAAVAGGRWVAGSGASAADLAGEARAQTAALQQVLAVAERHPELRADESFRALQAELADSETRVAASRTFYNDAVTLLRDRARTFPAALVARPLRIDRRELLDAAAFERTVPAVAG